MRRVFSQARLMMKLKARLMIVAHYFIISNKSISKTKKLCCNRYFYSAAVFAAEQTFMLIWFMVLNVEKLI